MLMNRPRQSTRSRTRSASSVSILRPFDRFATECNHQEGEVPRQPQAGYRAHNALASMREIDYLTSMTFLGVIRYITLSL